MPRKHIPFTQISIVTVKAYQRKRSSKAPHPWLNSWYKWGEFIYIVTEEGKSTLTANLQDTDTTYYKLSKFHPFDLDTLTLYQRHKADRPLTTTGIYQKESILC